MNKKILFGLSALVITGVLTGCNNPTTSSSTSKSENQSSTSVSESTSQSSEYSHDISERVTVRMSVNYDKSTGMKYNMDTEYETPKGTKVKNGDFKPVYTYLQNKLNFSINDVTDTSDKAVNQFKNTWAAANFKGVDIACGNVSDIVNNSVKGDSEMLVDLLENIDKMPNFKKFLLENPSVQQSIMTQKHGDPSSTGIYYAPYFDGFNDLEKMTLLRADYVKKLLDGEFNAADFDNTTGLIASFEYQPAVKDNTYTVTVPKSMDSNETKVVTKAQTENIVAQQNALAADQRTAQVMVKQYRDYIDAKYGKQLANRSDLFLGVDACYDADEMIALMRLVKVSPKALTGSADTVMVPFVPREVNNQRIADLYRWAAQLFGVRGLESRFGYLYINSDGKIIDARGEQATVDLIENLNKLYKEGLILSDFHNASSNGASNGKFAAKLIAGNGGGFMEYDYAQTQGAWNDNAASKEVEGYDFRPVIAPVAKWGNKGNTSYYSFTESWRSVKTQAWCISADAKSDPKVFDRTLAIFDWFYSEDGHKTNSYGPESEGYTEGTMNYQGREIPKFTAKTLEQLADANIGNGSYTNYLRKFVGATLPVGYIKEQGMEYQCTSQHSRDGLALINKALELGTYKHVLVSEAEDKFFQIVPSAFRISSGNADTITGLSKDKLDTINSNSSTSTYCMWDNYVMYGFGGSTGSETLKTTAQYLELVNTTWELPRLVRIYQDAYEAM